jgi:drug/metabolite transporter (DMT)-like permease
MKITKIWRANLLLLLTAAIWGFGFVAQRAGALQIGPLTYNALRFGLAGVALLAGYGFIRRYEPAFPSSRKAVVGAGCAAGTILFIATSLQTAGLQFTGAGKAGFITGLYVVLVPVLGLFWKQRTGPATWLGGLLAVAGLYLLSVSADFKVMPGDLLVMAGALMWALHVQAIGYFSRKVDSLKLSIGQFLITALFSLGAGLIFEHNTFGALGGAAIPILYGGLFSVGVAFTLQVVAQKDTHPSHAAVIMVSESMFAVLAGWLLLGEQFGGRELAGCGLMLAGMLLSQAGPFLHLKAAALRGIKPASGLASEE